MAIHFEITRNADWLQEYYQIREFCFRNDLGLISFDGSEDAFDRSGDIMIFREGDQCIGGARLSGRAGTQSAALPLEQEGLDLQRWFPQLSDPGASYCQWTRVALLPGHRTADMLRETCRAMIETAMERGYEYMFNVSGMTRARLYKRLHSCLGYDYRIMEEVPVPAAQGFSGLPHLLSVAVLGQNSMSESNDLPVPFARVA